MIFATINGVDSFNGFGAIGRTGLGAARTLVKGTDFNCNTSICYGIGAANHQLFKDLQAVINRYPSHAPITVDGFIGDATVRAAQSVAADSLLTLPGATRDAIAANAPMLLAHFTEFLTPGAPAQPAPRPPLVATTQPQPFPQQQQPTSTPPGVRPTSQPLPLPLPGQFSPGQVPVSPAAAALLPLPKAAAKIPLWVWITAGVTGAVVVGLVGYALRKPSPEALGYDRHYDRHYRRRR